MQRLCFISKGVVGLTHALVAGKTRVGRGEDNAVIIRHPSVSAVHCEIKVNGEEVIVKDLGSRNGTWVHGQLLRNQQAQLKAGQSVKFGEVQAMLESEYSELYRSHTDESAHDEFLRYVEKSGERRSRSQSPPAQLKPTIIAPWAQQS